MVKEKTPVLSRTEQKKAELLKCASCGDADAQCDLGHIYDGQGDEKEAEKWWLKAANAGNTDAQFELGYLYLQEGNDKESKRWWTEAANAGNTDAQFTLGLYHSRGNEEIEKWWTKAANAGDIDASLGLARLYKEQGNNEEAVRWVQKAIETAAEEGNENVVKEGTDLLGELR